VVCSSSTSPIYHPYTNAVTWGYAVFFWDDHFMGSGPPKDELLQALKKFDVFRCYVGTLGPQQMHEGFWNTIKRVTSPRVCKIAKKLQVFYLIYLYNGTEFCHSEGSKNKMSRKRVPIQLILRLRHNF